MDKRITAHQALEHEWLNNFDEKSTDKEQDLLENIKTKFDARRTFKKAINLVTLSNHLGHTLRSNSTASATNAEAAKIVAEEIKPVQEGIDQVLEKEDA